MKEIWLKIFTKGLRPTGTKGYFIFVLIFFLSEDKKNDVNDKHSEVDPTCYEGVEDPWNICLRN